MTNPIDHIAQSAPDIRLTSEAKSRIRSELVAHMVAHPVRLKPVISPYAQFLSILSPFGSLRIPAIALALLLIIGIGGATTYAAEGALPGDALYPVKVGVVEPVQGAFFVSPETKAEWNATLATTRLDEAEKLSLASRLTATDTAEIQERFNQSVAAAQENIDSLSEKNPDAGARAGASLALSLNAHAGVLGKLGLIASSTQAQHLAALGADVEAKVTRPKAVTMSAFAAVATTSASDSRLEQETRTEESHLLTRLGVNLSLFATTTTTASTTNATTTEWKRHDRPRKLVPVPAIPTELPTSGSSTTSINATTNATTSVSTELLSNGSSPAAPILSPPTISVPAVVGGGSVGGLLKL